MPEKIDNRASRVLEDGRNNSARWKHGRRKFRKQQKEANPINPNQFILFESTVPEQPAVETPAITQPEETDADKQK